MKKIELVSGNWSDYESVINENNISVVCDADMNCIISDDDADKLLSIVSNPSDFILGDY